MTTITRIVLAMAVLSLFGYPSLEASGSNGVQDTSTQQTSGVITGMTGTPLLGTGDGTRQGSSLGTAVAADKELRTGKDDVLEILWDHALILIRPQSTVTIHESKAGQTEVSLEGGSVRIALAYGGHPTDIVTVQTPSSRVYTRGGILEVDVLPTSPSLLSRVVSVFSKTETSTGPAPVETVRVIEGQSGIEPLKPTPGQSHMLEAGVQAHIAGGAVEQIVELSQNSKRVGLADTDQQQKTPGPLTQRLVNVHINHALEVERLMRAQKQAINQAGSAADPDLKGTIVATSLGVPSVSLGQSGTPSASPGPAPQPTPSGPVAPAPSPGVTSPLPSLPPVQSPTITTFVPGQSGGLNSRSALKDLLDDEKDRGKDKHSGRDREAQPTPINQAVTSPLPMLPSLQVQTNTTVDHSQSGGLNSRNLLKDVLDDERGGGKDKHNGRDRNRENPPPDSPTVTSPLPTLPHVQDPTVTQLDHSQVGGRNSHDLLKEMFDADKGGGKHGHQGKGSD
jgi:hypothetical protein